jgi:predicted alpha/beta superfamily hydrolase
MKLFIASLLFILTISLNGQNIPLTGYRHLQDTTLQSAHLGYGKNISVIVPQDYNPSTAKQYPLIVLFDRQNQVNCNYILQTISYLTAFDQMPASVIITIESDNDKRVMETALKPSNINALGEKNERFVIEELLPLARKKYHANNFELLIGHSRYAYFTTYLLARHLSTLNAVISVSPFYLQKNINLLDTLVNKVKTTGGIANNIYYQFATGDSIPDTQDYSLMAGALGEKPLPNFFKYNGYTYYYANHFTTPGLTASNALYTIFSQWTLAANKYYNDTLSEKTEADKYKKAMVSIADYGDKINFSLGTLNGKGWQYYNNNHKDRAIATWQVAINAYPGFSELYLYMALAAKEDKKPFDSYIKSFKESILNSTFYSEEDRRNLIKECEEIEKE